MGGDGGTLNNSRAEHAAVRRSLNLASDGDARRRLSRASVRECALTGEPLRPGETVVCRAGQLYNREAVVSHLLRRGTGVPHIRKLRRDVASVRAPLQCAITRAEVRADGSFSVGWNCGCVCAPVDVAGRRVAKPAEETQCAACAAEGKRVVLGQTAAQRAAIVQAIVAKRKADAAAKAAKAAGKKSVMSETVGTAETAETDGKAEVTKPDKRAAEEADTGRDIAKKRKLNTTNAVRQSNGLVKGNGAENHVVDAKKHTEKEVMQALGSPGT